MFIFEVFPSFLLSQRDKIQICFRLVVRNFSVLKCDRKTEEKKTETFQLIYFNHIVSTPRDRELTEITSSSVDQTSVNFLSSDHFRNKSFRGDEIINKKIITLSAFEKVNLFCLRGCKLACIQLALKKFGISWKVLIKLWHRLSSLSQQEISKRPRTRTAISQNT